MPKKKGKKRNGSMKEQMEGLAIAITPITIEKKRSKKQEGGDIEAQMEELVPVEETQIPDEQMEDEYMDFIISESLTPEEETSLMNKLEADPELSVMFDKLMETATEFSGSGPVEGPGSEVSDSIPARLSDGEFVMTADATKEIGADNLQRMMGEAEEADRNRQQIAVGG